MNPLTQQTLALSATLQAAYLVNQLARQGECKTTEQHVLIDSLFKLDNINTLSIYQNADNLKIGLTLLKHTLEKNHKIKDIKELIYYSIQLNILAKKVSRKKSLLLLIEKEITALNTQNYFDQYHPNTQAKLAELYRQTAGKLSPTIMIRGEPIYLNNASIANQIRTLLLSGVRASMLRRAHGGNPLTLIINKRRILEIINDLADN